MASPFGLRNKGTESTCEVRIHVDSRGFVKVGTSIKLSERGALKSIEGLACQTLSFLLNSLFFIM